jgi:hypothetical protein
VAENIRPPVAIRIVRPYESEDEFLEHELETVGKTSVILIGAHSRPTGVILRFEVTLASGATILRGEGRVLAHKENAFRGQPGLSLRFTRLDPKSKALVDRAAAIREAKAAGDPAPMSVRPSAPPEPPESAPSAPSPSSPSSRRPPAQSRPPSASRPPPSGRPGSMRARAASRPDEAIADALTAETPPPPSRQARGASAPPPEPKPASLPPQPPAVLKRSEPPRDEAHDGSAAANLVVPPAPPPPVAAASAPRAPGDARVVERPANRDDLLSRLRDRAAALPRERIDQILAKA